MSQSKAAVVGQEVFVTRRITKDAEGVAVVKRLLPESRIVVDIGGFEIALDADEWYPVKEDADKESENRKAGISPVGPAIYRYR